MKIENLIWLSDIIDKLTFKHQVDTDEVEEVFDNCPGILDSYSSKTASPIGKPKYADDVQNRPYGQRPVRRAFL